MRRHPFRFALAVLQLFVAVAACAEPVVPAPLEPWRAWTLRGQEFRACPLIAGKAAATAADFLCAWPGRLAIAVDAGGASVAQRWQVDADAWVPLPGDAEHWPQQVVLDGQPVAVVDRGGPSVRLAAGSHELRARIPWRERPQSLRVPPQAGLVALTVDGKAVEPVQRDGDELALGRSGAAAPEADSLELRVYRRLADGVPATLTTSIELSVSGQAREEIVGPVLPQGFAPLALDGDWPARLDADGRLRVRVQPGQETLTLEARAIAPLEAAAARLAAAPWPKQEIWSYAGDPRLRVTAAEGAVQVDPNQAQVPQDWRGLPAFALGDGDRLTIEQRSRGLAPDERNRLTLRREMWLDFDGGGWFAHDRVQGEMLQGWRFDAAAPFVLERAQVGAGADAESLLVTRGAAANLGGVEWRTPKVDLAAGLRIAPAAGRLSITGWQDGFDRVDTVLHLPNGYKLIGAPGADRADGSWTSRWSLLDVFLAAVLAMLAWRALGVVGGVAAIAYLLLGYQEWGAPVWSLLAACALVLVARALPAGRLADAAGWLRNAALVVLVLAALPFVAAQVRQALYPQLEGGDGYAKVSFGREEARDEAPDVLQQEALPAPPAPAAPPPMAESADSAMKMRAPSATGKLETITVTGSRILRKDLMDRYGASTVVQTGAGEPDWQLGHRYDLSWNGPVLPAQDVRLVIAPPWLVRPLRLVLVALLAFLVLRAARPSLRLPLRRPAGPLLCAAFVLSPLGTTAQAQSFPPADLLADLRSRLTEAPKCAPACASIAKAEVSARGDAVEVALEAHAAERVAVPLPFDEKALVLRTLRVDGIAQDAIARSGEALWVALPRGVHRVELSFAAAADKVALAFPLKPMRALFAGEGWDASGLADDRLQTETLTLARARSEGEAAASVGAQQFAPFVRVRRTLTLDLDWSVDTRVERMAPREGGFTVEVPLLAGEHVTSAGTRVANGRVAAAIANGEDAAYWSSTLDKGDAVRLAAPPLADRAEVWRVVVNPTWHVEFDGVPVVAPEGPGDAEDDYRAFEFHPLPGETLAMTVTRPEAAQGATRAIDGVRLRHEVGQRASTSLLTLALRTSQGGEHSIALPPGAELLGVSRDGEALNLRLQDGRLSLPLLPGRHEFQVRFRDDAAIGTLVRTPALALGLPAANVGLDLELPQDRWLLATRGPTVGPAVLYWGELAVMLLVAFALSRLRDSPLRLWQWVLLGIGFSTWSWIALLLVVAWLFALRWRARAPSPQSAIAFNLAQVGLAALTLAAFVCVFDSIQHGLLGRPEMHVVGNGSNAFDLRWFADRSADALPRASALSLPLWSYQLAMLAWALWLAAALVRWLREGFAAWTRGGYWRARPKPVVDLPPIDAPPPPPAV